MNLKSLIVHRLILLLGVILLSACTSTSPKAVPVLSTSTSILPPVMLAPPTATQVLPTATFVPPTNTPLPPSTTPTQELQLSPSARSEISMAYNSKTNQVIFFGGMNVDPCWASCPPFFDDTWIYDATANTWTQIRPPSAPSPRDNAPLAYDSESDRIILVAGAISGKNYAPRETWAFDMNTMTWTMMKTQGPAYRFGHSMVYDSKADRMIVFGGYNNEKSLVLNDTWAYDYNTDTWTEMKPAVSPPGRNFQSMVYDSKADRVILWGGWGNPDVGNDRSLWVYDYHKNTWEERKPSEGPTCRFFHNMAYDSKADRTIVYGGYTGLATTETFNFRKYSSSETWAYDYNHNTWMQLDPATNPGPLTSAGQVYIPSIDRTLLFGGRLGYGIFNEKTWLYDYTTNTWMDVTPKP